MVKNNKIKNLLDLFKKNVDWLAGRFIYISENKWGIRGLYFLGFYLTNINFAGYDLASLGGFYIWNPLKLMPLYGAYFLSETIYKVGEKRKMGIFTDDDINKFLKKSVNKVDRLQ